ncbi:MULTISPECIES: hypothetical protein [Legionella]|uniref:hypothetical protein n=1 Tax=Legionella TaxID=445 RepID=UPI000962B0F0|nr:MULTISPECIES: hypothetical protein [Legionella]MBN9226482.1 hypothetical protein [Legionella steelei]OJW12213.1 MAG: hypothetical protein BGO44_04070 [Legionella sp. 39-23]
MSQSKEEQLKIVDEVQLLLNELRSLKNTQFHRLKQPEFGQMVFNGIVKKFSPFATANKLFTSLIPTERPEQKSDLEVDEVNELWRELWGIFSQLELDINSIASLPEKERLPQQKAIFTEALKQIGPKFARAIEIDTDIKSFEYSEKISYAEMQSLAQKKMAFIKKQLESELSVDPLKQKWKEVEQIINKEFQQELPITSDYVNLLNALHQLEDIEKIPRNRVPNAQKIEKVARKKKSKVGKIVDGVEDQTRSLSELNASLISTIISNLEVLHMLETTQWKELKLKSFPQNEAIRKLEDFYQKALGSSPITILERFSQFTVKICELKNEMFGEESVEAEQLKKEADAQLLQLEKEMDNFSQEAEKLQAMKLNREQYLRAANKLLEEQNKLLKERLEKINPIINNILAIDKILIDFDKSAQQEELFSTKKAAFYERYEPFLNEVADFKNELFLRLKNKNGPEIEELKQELEDLVQQTLKAEENIQESNKPNLANYSNLLNHVFKLEKANERARNIFKKIEDKIPEQKRENQIREEFSMKRDILLEINETLRLPDTEFKVQEVQLEIIKFLDTQIPRFEKKVKHAPINQVEEELEAINSTLEQLGVSLLRAKVTPTVAQQHFKILCNKYRYSGDPLLNTMEQLRDAPHCRDIRVTIDLNEDKRFKGALHREDFIIATENYDFEEWTNDLTLWPREELVAYCKQLVEFAEIALIGGIEAYSRQYNPEVIAAFEDAMAFASPSQVNPLTLFRQMSAFISVAADNTDELDRLIKSIYSSYSDLKRDFKKQYPSVDIEAMPTFLTELEFSEEIVKQISDERLTQILIDVNNQGDLEAFLRQELQTYHYLQRGMELPGGEQVEHSNHLDLLALRTSRDVIATILKAHYLTAIQKQIEIEQAIAPKSKIMDDLLNLKNSVASNPIHAFLSNNLSGVIENRRRSEDKESIENRLQKLKNEQIYNSFNTLYEIQMGALGHSLSQDLEDDTTIDSSEKLSRLQEKIKANVQRHPLEQTSFSLKKLGFPQDFYSFIEKNKDFLKWTEFLQESLGKMEAPFLSNEDKEFLQEVSQPSWLKDLNEEIKSIILTEPQDAEHCFKLVGRLNELSAQVERLSGIQKKWMQMIDSVLKAYPSESRTYNPRFHGTQQADEWGQIIGVLNSETVKQNLIQYRSNRAQLEKIKEHGFEVGVDYKNFLTTLQDNKLILNAGRETYKTLKDLRKKEVGELPKKLLVAIEVLGELNATIIHTYSKDMTKEQKALLRAINGNMVNLWRNGQRIFNDLENSSLGSEEICAAITEASDFLTSLPTTVSRCFDEEHYNQLNEAGLDDIDKIYNRVMEVIAEFCKEWEFEFDYQRRVGQGTQNYKDRISAITKQIDVPEEGLNLSKK